MVRLRVSATFGLIVCLHMVSLGYHRIAVWIENVPIDLSFYHYLSIIFDFFYVYFMCYHHFYVTYTVYFPWRII